jgi:hypothetical protein
MAAPAASAAVAAASDKLYVGLGRSDVFLVENIEGRQGNVGDFLLTESEFVALSGVRRRHIYCRATGYRGCTARQRQGQPGGPQQRYCACPLLSLRRFLRLRHGDLPYLQSDRVRNAIVPLGIGIRQALRARLANNIAKLPTLLGKGIG